MKSQRKQYAVNSTNVKIRELLQRTWDWDEDQRMEGSCRKIRDQITTNHSHTSLYLHSNDPRQQFMTTPCEAIMEDTRQRRGQRPCSVISDPSSCHESHYSGYLLQDLSPATRFGRLLDPLITAVENSFEARVPECSWKSISKVKSLILGLLLVSEQAPEETLDNSTSCFLEDSGGGFSGIRLQQMKFLKQSRTGGCYCQ